MVFRFLTSGESHGRCLTSILEGVPAGIKVDEGFINAQLSRRQKGYGRGGRMKIETDRISVTAGIRHGYTTGSPVCFVIENKDWVNWEIPMASASVDMQNPEVAQKVLARKITHVRPGHADLTGAVKYNHNDVRDILERSSARETAMRVAVGAFAMDILRQFGIEIFAHIVKIGDVEADVSGLSYEEIKQKAELSEVRCADTEASEKMKKTITEAGEQGDTIGGVFEVVALNLPVGLGSYVHWDRKLDGRLAQAVMSIPAIKSVAFGIGEKSGEVFGSQMHDEIYPKDESGFYVRKTNNAGGVEGGMTNGMPVVIRAAMKPIPTMKKPLNSVDLETGEAHVAHYERSDVCASPAAAVVGEAMVAVVILEAFLEKFGGDSFEEINANYENYKKMCSGR